MKQLYFLSILVFCSQLLWAQTQLPDSLILYGKPGATALIVDKAQCSVNIFQKQSSWEKIGQYRCTTGKSQGDKQVEGDLKTPTGLYFFTDAWTGQELVQHYGLSARIYGAGAFELNYPNHLDKVLYKKNGSGIWLHGTDKEDPSATKGCISTTNTDFLKTAQYIALYETPLIIEETISYVSRDDIEKTRWELLDFVEKWRTAWGSDQIDQYLSFYAKKFRTKNFNYAQWQRFKRLINEKNQNRQITIEDISIIKAKDIYHIQFTQRYSSTGTNDFGKKYLYVVEEENNFRIISEKWIPFQKKLSPFSPQYVKANANKRIAEKFRNQTL